MLLYRKNRAFLLIILLFLIPACCFLKSDKNENQASISPLPALSADRADNPDRLITLLENSGTQEERLEIFKINRELINSEFINLLKNKYREADSEDKRKKLLLCAVEAAEFIDDKKELPELLLRYARYEGEELKDANPPSLQKAFILFQEEGNTEGEASCYYEQSIQLENLGKYEESIEVLNKAMDIYDKTGNDDEKASCYSRMSDLYWNLKEIDKAIDYNKKAIETFKGYNEEYRMVWQFYRYRELEMIYSHNDFLDEAWGCLERQKEIINKLPDKSEQYDKEELKNIYYNSLAGWYASQSHYYHEAGKVDEAINSLQKSIEVYRPTGGDDDTLQWKFYRYREMLVIYFTNGFLEEAEECLEIQKELIEKLEPPDNNLYYKDELMLEYYSSLAIQKRQQGKYEEAIKIYKKIIEVAEKTGNQRMLQDGYGGLGTIYYSCLGQKDTGINYFLEGAGKITDKTDEELVVSNYTNLALIYRIRKEYDKAIEYYLLAFEATKGFTIEEIGEHRKMSCLSGIAEIYIEKNEFDQALRNLLEILKISEYLYKTYGDSAPLSSAYSSFANFYFKKGEYEKALDYHCKALDSAKKTSSMNLLALSYENLGDFYFNTEKYPEAGDMFIEAIAIREKLNQLDVWRSYFSLGKAYEKEGDLEEAYNYYLSAIEIIENMRQEIKLEEFKRDFMQDKIEVYEYMINLLIKMKREDEAFEFNEKARARAFLDILANHKVDIRHGIDPERAKKEEELKNRIQYLSANLKEEKEKPAVSQRSVYIENTDKTLQQLKLEYEAIINEIKLENPEYMTLISVNPFSLKEIQSFPDKDTVIVEYFLCKDRFFIWIAGNDCFNTVTAEYKKEDLESLVKTYRETAFDDITLEKINSDDWKKISKELYGVLFKEAEKFVEGTKRLVICPYGTLHYLPFHTLMDDKGKTLIEKYEIVYLPSASILKFCQDKNRHDKSNLLAFELGNFKAEGFSPLPGTEDEVEGIASVFPQNEIYAEENMKTEVLQEKGKNFKLLHFATHGILVTEAPLFSSLIFADRPLNVYEIFDLDLSAYLVTLSACKTGFSEEAKGDELVGMSRAFIYAGSPSICSSLWDVSDKSTAELMEMFYFHLKDKNKSESLRLAQLEVMKKYPHPFFWGPFILIGDWE